MCWNTSHCNINRNSCCSRSVPSHCAFYIQYRNGRLAEGTIARDILRFKGYGTYSPIITNVFGLIMSESVLENGSSWSSTTAGILGIGHRGASCYPSCHSGILDDFYTQHYSLGYSDSFTLCYSSNQGYLSVGGIDTGLYDGAIAWTSCTSSSVYEFIINDIRVYNSSVGSFEIMARIDSSTRWIYLPEALYNQFQSVYSESLTVSGISSSTLFGSGTNIIMKQPSDDWKSIEFIVDRNISLFVPSYFYLQPVIWYGSQAYQFAIRKHTENYIILGSAFIQAFTTIFDRDRERIGFAQVSRTCFDGEFGVVNIPVERSERIEPYITLQPLASETPIPTLPTEPVTLSPTPSVTNNWKWIAIILILVVIFLIVVIIFLSCLIHLSHVNRQLERIKVPTQIEMNQTPPPAPLPQSQLQTAPNSQLNPDQSTPLSPRMPNISPQPIQTLPVNTPSHQRVISESVLTDTSGYQQTQLTGTQTHLSPLVTSVNTSMGGASLVQTPRSHRLDTPRSSISRTSVMTPRGTHSSLMLQLSPTPLGHQPVTPSHLQLRPLSQNDIQPSAVQLQPVAPGTAQGSTSQRGLRRSMVPVDESNMTRPLGVSTPSNRVVRRSAISNEDMAPSLVLNTSLPPTEQQIATPSARRSVTPSHRGYATPGRRSLSASRLTPRSVNSGNPSIFDSHE